MVNPKLTGHSLSAPSVELRYNPQALIMTIRSFHEGYWSVKDYHVVLEVLAAPLLSEAGLPLGHSLASLRKCRLRNRAESSPFDMKD
jgi:hypothetical protein